MRLGERRDVGDLAEDRIGVDRDDLAPGRRRAPSRRSAPASWAAISGQSLLHTGSRKVTRSSSPRRADVETGLPC